MHIFTKYSVAIEKDENKQAGRKESSDEVKIMFTGLVPARKHKQMIHDIGIEKASTVMRELRSLIGDFNMACYFSCAGAAASTDASTDFVQSKPRASSLAMRSSVSFLVPSILTCFSECLAPAQN